MDLSTTYLGLKLRTPLVPSAAAPLTEDIDQIKRMEDAGELDNTLVVVTSDNGMPFPRAKVCLYDPGVRMPLAVRWPKHGWPLIWGSTSRYRAS